MNKDDKGSKDLTEFVRDTFGFSNIGIDVSPGLHKAYGPFQGRITENVFGDRCVGHVISAKNRW